MSTSPISLAPTPAELKPPGFSLVFLFSLTLFLSAGLLFLVQPMIAKMILPKFGGSPGVWTMSMVFFQAALLAGYGYVHAVADKQRQRRQFLLQVVLLGLGLAAVPFLVLALDPPSAWRDSIAHAPVLMLLVLLAVSVGVPFFVLSTTAPLLQKWFAGTGHLAAKDPYFLYAASNCGSLAALLGYPLLMEPNLTLRTQAWLWMAGYGLLAVFIFLCIWRTWQTPGEPIHPGEPEGVSLQSKDPLTFERSFRWVMLAFVPSSMMLGVTTHITADLAPIPLLWVVPLSLYLITFILAFARLPVFIHRLFQAALPAAVLLEMFLLLFPLLEPLWLVITLHLVSFFVVAMFCHGELARDRPPPEFLTPFFLWIAVGGVLGGIFNGLLAPVLFSTVVEYPLVMVLACLLDAPLLGQSENLVRGWRNGILPIALGIAAALFLVALQGGFVGLGWAKAATRFALPGVVCLIVTMLISGRPVRFGLGVGIIMLTLAVEAGGWSPYGKVIRNARSFFGVHRIVIDPDGHFINLFHGGTIHGKQLLRQDGKPQHDSRPVGYFYTSGPIGQVFEAFREDPSKREVGIIGLGTGSLAAYAKPNQHFTYYEIDPAVEEIARNGKYFTYLQDCKAGLPKVILGDARLTLTQAPDHGYQIFILDAFSSDAIPMHLVTREAVQLYFDKLAEDGILALHISNRYLDLEPVLAAIAKDLGVVCRAQLELDRDIAPEEFRRGKDGSHWLIMARKEEQLGKLAKDPRWKPARLRADVPVWTDDFYNLFRVFRWGQPNPSRE